MASETAASEYSSYGARAEANAFEKVLFRLRIVFGLRCFLMLDTFKSNS